MKHLLHRWGGLGLALLLGTAGLLLIVQLTAAADTIEAENTLFLAALIGLCLSVLAGLIFLLREALRRIWLAGVEQMRAEALAEHYRFLRRLDHEIKNPLTALRAGLASLALTLRDPAQRALVTTLADDAERLSRLISNLRKLAEIDRVPLDVQRVALLPFCQQVHDLLQDHPLSHQRRWTISFVPPAYASAALQGDPDLLLLAVHNVIDNAFKFTRPGDTIAVLCRVEAATFMLDVTDTGVGISPGEQPLVWEELYRGQNAAALPGSGIGLAMVRTIIDRHFGTFQIVSTPGNGTTLTLSLPLL